MISLKDIAMILREMFGLWVEDKAEVLKDDLKINLARNSWESLTGIIKIHGLRSSQSVPKIVSGIKLK